MTIKRPTTMVLSVRADLRDLAIVALWLNNQGQGAQNMGELGRRSIELLSDMIKKRDPSLAIISTADAISQLDQMGLKRGDRNTHSLVKQLQLEDAVMELREPTQKIISLENVQDIVERVRVHETSGKFSSAEMKRVTDALGGAVDERDDDIGEHDGSGSGARNMEPQNEDTKASSSSQGNT